MNIPSAGQLSSRRHVLSGLLTLALLVGGLGFWAIMTDISGAVIARGEVRVAQSRQVVQHPDGGVVDAVLVREGATVTAGTPLLRLDGTMLRHELAIVESQFFEILARRGRLEAERDALQHPQFPPELTAAATADAAVAALMAGQERLFAARSETVRQTLAQLERRAGQIENQIEGIAAQRGALERQLGYLHEELAAQQRLLRQGLAQAPRVLALQREEARLQGEAGALAAESARADGAVTEIRLERLRLDSERREAAEAELRDLGIREFDLSERRRALRERIARLEIRAPVAGVVHGLAVTAARAVLRPAEEVLHIVPQDRPLVVAARVDPSGIDQVHIGQEARLMFGTTSARTTPERAGRVVLVSADTFTDEAGRASYYRIEIALEPETATIQGQSLIPGMPVDVFLTTDARTPLAYLARPLARYFGRAFREL